VPSPDVDGFERPDRPNTSANFALTNLLRRKITDRVARCVDGVSFGYIRIKDMN